MRKIENKLTNNEEAFRKGIFLNRMRLINNKNASFFYKLNYQWHLDLENGKDIPSSVILGVTESDDFVERIRDNSAFDCLPIQSHVCRLGSDRYPDMNMSFGIRRTIFYGNSFGKDFCFKHSEDRVIKQNTDEKSIKRNYNFT